MKVTRFVTTPEDIVGYIMGGHPYHECGHREVQYALAVKCFAHYGAVASCWVYIGIVTPHFSTKKKQEEEAEKKEAREMGPGAKPSAKT